MGANQYLAAVGRPPHLKTIFPEMAPFDLYALLHDNGIFREDFAHTWSSDVRRRDVSDSASLIDSDPTGAIVAEARAEHASDRDAFLIFRDARFRDSIDPDSGDALYEIFNVGPRWSAEVIPVYHLAGWYDLRPGDAFLYLLNAGGPFHLVLGPWSHTGTAGFDLAQEHINWYDACLKHRGEAPAGQKITYAVMSSEGSVQWRAGTRCEFERVSRVELSLKADRWTIHSNGRHECSTESAIMITYRVDPNASSGIASRWSNGYGGPFGYGDMRSNDRRALTFTSPPLAAPLELRGFPCIRLSLEAHDALNIFVFLEDVHPDGWSQYLTEGALALAHRTLGGAPYEVPEIPFYPGRASDIQPPLSAPARVEIPLFPIAFCFPTGHRLRVAITGADRDNAEEVVTTRHSRFVFDFRTEHNVLVLPCGNSDGPSFCYGESP
jgi:putative CocE/NonD family hydrolase